MMAGLARRAGDDIAAGWNGPLRHLVTGSFVALPVSLLLVAVFTFSAQLHPGVVTGLGGVVQLGLSLAIAGRLAARAEGRT